MKVAVFIVSAFWIVIPLWALQQVVPILRKYAVHLLSWPRTTPVPQSPDLLWHRGWRGTRLLHESDQNSWIIANSEVGQKRASGRCVTLLGTWRPNRVIAASSWHCRSLQESGAAPLRLPRVPEGRSSQQPDAAPPASLEFEPGNRFPVCTGSSRAA